MYKRRVWKARSGVKLNRFTKSNETSSSVELTQNPESISISGTPFTADAMNNIEQGVANINQVLHNQGFAAFNDLGVSALVYNNYHIDNESNIYITTTAGKVFLFNPSNNNLTELADVSADIKGITSNETHIFIVTDQIYSAEKDLTSLSFTEYDSNVRSYTDITNDNQYNIYAVFVNTVFIKANDGEDFIEAESPSFQAHSKRILLSKDRVITTGGEVGNNDSKVYYSVSNTLDAIRAKLEFTTASTSIVTGLAKDIDENVYVFRADGQVDFIPANTFNIIEEAKYTTVTNLLAGGIDSSNTLFSVGNSKIYKASYNIEASGNLKINGSTKTAGAFYTGTTNPDNTNRLNYDGSLVVTDIRSRECVIQTLSNVTRSSAGTTTADAIFEPPTGVDFFNFAYTPMFIVVATGTANTISVKINSITLERNISGGSNQRLVVNYSYTQAGSSSSFMTPKMLWYRLI